MTSTEAPLKRRHPMIAFAGGVIAPGLGLWLTGRPRAAVATAVVAATILVLVPIAVVDGSVGIGAEHLMKAMSVSRAAIVLLTALASTVLAFTDAPRRYRGFEHPWWALGFGLLSYAASHMLRYEFSYKNIADYSLGCAVGGSDGIAACPGPEGTVTPTTQRPARWAVIVKRGFVPADVAINDVVAVRAGTHSWKGKLPGFARVIAKAGSTVSVDENGRITVDGFPVVAEPCAATVPHFGLPCTAEKQATPSGSRERVVVRTSFPREFATTSVGPGQVFVLPDDRGRQLQAPAGLVSLADLEGRVVVAR